VTPWQRLDELREHRRANVREAKSLILHTAQHALQATPAERHRLDELRREGEQLDDELGRAFNAIP
jgi:hypothetical protein